MRRSNREIWIHFFLSFPIYCVLLFFDSPIAVRSLVGCQSTFRRSSFVASVPQTRRDSTKRNENKCRSTHDLPHAARTTGDSRSCRKTTTQCYNGRVQLRTCHMNRANECTKQKAKKKQINGEFVVLRETKRGRHVAQLHANDANAQRSAMPCATTTRHEDQLESVHRTRCRFSLLRTDETLTATILSVSLCGGKKE